MSPRQFDFPDVRLEYDVPGAYCGTPAPAIQRSYQKSPTGRNYYEQIQGHYEPQLKSPKGSRSLEYGAQVSPKYDKHKKFEYYEPSSPDKEDDDSSYIDYSHSSIYYKKKKKTYNKSPNGVSSLDDYHSSSTAGGGGGVAGGGAGIEHRNTTTSCNYDNNKRNSIVTDSTNSGTSEFSQATTARCGSSETEIRSRECDRRRRHAINITNNPGYQVNMRILVV